MLINKDNNNNKIMNKFYISFPHVISVYDDSWNLIKNCAGGRGNKDRKVL